MFSCCFGECPYPYTPDENIAPVILTAQKRHIVTVTKKLFDVDSDGLFERLYIPEDVINSSKYNFLN